MECAKSCIYPPLHYCLINYEMLKKRAYIGRFLQKTDIPSEFMTDSVIQEDLQQQQELQVNLNSKIIRKSSSKLTNCWTRLCQQIKIQMIYDQR